MIQRPFTLDFIEFMRFVLCSAITSPPNFYWQGFLERTWPSYVDADPAIHKRKDSIALAEKGESTTVAETARAGGKPVLHKYNVAVKWFIDCITLGAIVNTAAFLIIIGALKGMSGAQIATRLRTETIPIIVAGYRVWPLVNFIAMTLVPWERRIVFFSCIGLFWGIYMSIISARL